MSEEEVKNENQKYIEWFEDYENKEIPIEELEKIEEYCFLYTKIRPYIHLIQQKKVHLTLEKCQKLFHSEVNDYEGLQEFITNLQLEDTSIIFYLLEFIALRVDYNLVDYHLFFIHLLVTYGDELMNKKEVEWFSFVKFIFELKKKKDIFNLKMVLYLIENRYLQDDKYIELFIENSINPMWVVSNYRELPKNKKAVDYSAYLGKFEHMMTFINNGYPYDKTTLIYAVSSLNVKSIDFLIEKKCEWDPNVWYVINRYFMKRDQRTVKPLSDVFNYVFQLYHKNPDVYSVPEDLKKMILLKKDEDDKNKEEEEKNNEEEKEK